MNSNQTPKSNSEHSWIKLCKRHFIPTVGLTFLFIFPASPSSSNRQRVMYLNTGLTSTKNYGKTILTKVSSYS